MMPLISQSDSETSSPCVSVNSTLRNFGEDDGIDINPEFAFNINCAPEAEDSPDDEQYSTPKGDGIRRRSRLKDSSKAPPAFVRSNKIKRTPPKTLSKDQVQTNLPPNEALIDLNDQAGPSYTSNVQPGLNSDIGSPSSMEWDYSGQQMQETDATQSEDEPISWQTIPRKRKEPNSPSKTNSSTGQIMSEVGRIVNSRNPRIQEIITSLQHYLDSLTKVKGVKRISLEAKNAKNALSGKINELISVTLSMNTYLPLELGQYMEKLNKSTRSTSDCDELRDNATASATTTNLLRVIDTRVTKIDPKLENLRILGIQNKASPGVKLLIEATKKFDSINKNIDYTGAVKSIKSNRPASEKKDRSIVMVYPPRTRRRSNTNN